jgi:hypothetical protein
MFALYITHGNSLQMEAEIRWWFEPNREWCPSKQLLYRVESCGRDQDKLREFYHQQIIIEYLLLNGAFWDGCSSSLGQ